MWEHGGGVAAFLCRDFGSVQGHARVGASASALGKVARVDDYDALDDLYKSIN